MVLLGELRLGRVVPGLVVEGGLLVSMDSLVRQPEEVATFVDLIHLLTEMVRLEFSVPLVVELLLLRSLLGIRPLSQVHEALEVAPLIDVVYLTTVEARSEFFETIVMLLIEPLVLLTSHMLKAGHLCILGLYLFCIFLTVSDAVLNGFGIEPRGFLHVPRLLGDHRLSFSGCDLVRLRHCENAVLVGNHGLEGSVETLGLNVQGHIALAVAHGSVLRRRVVLTAA